MVEFKRKETIISKIQKHDEWVIGALIALYQCQTTEEQAVNSTTQQNNAGFNALDAPILSNISNFFLTRGYLTQKQISFVRRTITKYQKQLENLKIEPNYLKTAPAPKKAFQAKVEEFAGMYKGGTRIQIRFKYPYGDERFVTTKDKIKSLVEAKWEKAFKTWNVKLNNYNLMKLKEWNFEFGKSLEEHYQNNKIEIVPLKSIINIPGVEYPLYGFQGEGVAFIEAHNGRAIIADEMGLGKTIQALAWIQWRETQRRSVTPAAIFPPANVKINWGREAEKWCPSLKTSVLNGRPQNSLSDTDADIFIINFDIMANVNTEIPIKDENGKQIYDLDKKTNKKVPKTETITKFIGWAEKLEDFGIKTAVIDECHYLKNDDANRTQATIKFSRKCENIIALSGTPIVKRPIEFWNILSLVAPKEFDNYWHYVHTYCDATRGRFGWDFTGASNTLELNKRLQSMMLRRLKKNVLKDLPEKQRAVIPMEIDNRREYELAEQSFSTWYYKKYGELIDYKNDALVKIEKLKQIAVKGKMKPMTEWIENFLTSDEKLLIFSTHHATVDTFKTKFKKWGFVQHDGRLSQTQKQTSIDRFSTDDDIKLFLGNVKASGTGVDGLQGSCSNSCFAELPWNPSECDQAEDRLHRIGQRDGVMTWYPIAEDTVEVDILEQMDEKRIILSQILDGEDPPEGDMLKKLLDKHKKHSVTNIIRKIRQRR